MKSLASVVDPHTRARLAEARVTHLALAVEVDFERRELRCTATLDLEVAEGVGALVLDTRRLSITSVRDEAGRALRHELGPEDPILGAPLAIPLEPATRRVVVEYTTSPDAEALQWLEPAQTAGGAHPFLFTQGHAIHTRSWIPLPDSPAARLTYEAEVSVPAPLVAVMSAAATGVSEADVSRVFRFRMDEPIPPYLVALAVGDLARAEVGPRTAVFAEPSVLPRAAAELAETERMVEAAEALLGPYLWGRFDVVVMPPSFPYGGMENPRLTFASPSLIVGDRSLTTVIAHELAHAWAGNLVTNATWADFWINEGTTVYLELRLSEALWGAEGAALLCAWGLRELDAEIARMGATSPDTRLHYDMTGRDPAEGVTVVPYLKGAALFWALEAEVGKERLLRWLRSWFERRAFQSVTTEDLVADLGTELLSPEERARLPLERWVSEPGSPAFVRPPRSTLLERVERAAAHVLAGGSPSALDVGGFTPQAWRSFLGLLLEGAPDAAQLSALDARFALSASQNVEILLPWLRLQVRLERAEAVPRIEAFLAEHGRMKHLRPLYSDLLETGWGEALARRAYAASRPRYHALVRAGLDRLLAARA